MRRASWVAITLGLCLSLAACTARTPPHAMPGTVTVAFLDVGQGDAVLIRSPEGKTALVDAGQSSNVVTQLERQGVTSLDLVVVSHHHFDHYGGMDDVIKKFRPRVFLASGSSHSSERYLKLLRLVRDLGIQAIGPTQTARKIELGTVVLTIFPQAPDDLNEENNNSLGLRVAYGGFSVLLPGDAETHERRWWEDVAAELCADATVLKLAHHGSRNGTDEAWLDLVRPQVAVASLGKDNDFHHPHPETVELLNRYQVPFYRTDRDGTVTIRSDGLNWQAFTDPRPSGSGSGYGAGSGSSSGSSTNSKSGSWGWGWEWPGPDLRRARSSRGRRHTRPTHASERIDLNRASRTQLRTIPGIGPVLAERIVKGRPYRSVDELIRIEGIGEKRVGDFRPFVRAE